MSDSALKIAADVRTGARSAGEVLEAHLRVIEARERALNCFTARTVARARAEAGAVDAARARGATLPPLAGVPYAAKNLFDIEGITTLCGASFNADNPPAAADAFLVRRMREAGAILVGATNMDENAYGFTCENTFYGPTRNPHDATRVSGGSSGGSAAAVGAGMVPLSLGSDTSGSIRVPASLCGIFGLKPTYGRLSRGGTLPFVDSLDHVGPFARTVADLAAVYDVLQGADAEDRVCAQRTVEPVGTPRLPQGARIGVLQGWFHDWAGPAARSVVAQAAAVFDRVEDCELKGAEAARGAAFLITGAEGGALHKEGLKKQYARFEPASRDRLVAGSIMPASWVVKAQHIRRQVYEEALSLFERFDVLLAPAAPLIAPKIGSDTVVLNGQSLPTRASLGVLTQPISCIGLPALTAPLWPAAGEGMSVGVQLIAAPWREDLCIAAAALLEEARVAYAKSA